MKEQQWDKWMHQTLEGDKDAYRQLLMTLRPWLSAFFSKRISPHAFVEDLVQETMITLHEKRHTYDPSQPFMPWLVAVAKHRWIDHLRKGYRRNETSMDDDIDFPAPESDITAGNDISKLLQKIPLAQAEVIRLVKLHGLSVEQAARRTGHSPASVKVMIHRGLKRLSLLVKEIDE